MIRYNEFKLEVHNQQLQEVKFVLDFQFGGSDPFSEGIVDSIYYDTTESYLFDQCDFGYSSKQKIRIRGYGDNNFSQLQLKDKDMTLVSKIKANMRPINCPRLEVPPLLSLEPKIEGERKNIGNIFAYANSLGHFIPVVRVRYKRYRYRVRDYRVTLDTNIEILGYETNAKGGFNYFVLPRHVLEIKTFSKKISLPSLELIKLRQTSFSKFYLGLLALREQEAILGDNTF